MEGRLNLEVKEASTWWQVNKPLSNIEQSSLIVPKTVKKSDLEVNVCKMMNAFPAASLE